MTKLFGDLHVEVVNHGVSNKREHRVYFKVEGYSAILSLEERTRATIGGKIVEHIGVRRTGKEK